MQRQCRRYLRTSVENILFVNSNEFGSVNKLHCAALPKHAQYFSTKHSQQSLLTHENTPLAGDIWNVFCEFEV